MTYEGFVLSGMMRLTGPLKRGRNRAMKKVKYCHDHEVSLGCVESTGRKEA